MKTSEIATLKTWITESNRIVFFGGAGVSTESGIPDFRSVDGLYHQKFDYPPETILSHSFFYSHTEEFYRFYREKMLPLEAEPNAAHLALATLEREGKLRAIGISNFYADRMVDFAVFRRIKPMVNQVETHIFNQQKTLKTWADKYGIQLEAWRPLGKTARKPLTILLFCRLERNTEKQRRR